MIRPAQPIDAAALAALYLILTQDSRVKVLPERIAALLDCPNNHLLVAQINGTVLGTAHLSLVLDAMYGRQPYAIVENLVVLPSARGRGIGKALLQAIEAICLEHDCSKIMLLSSAHREQAHGFFESQAYAGDKKRGFVKYRSAMCA